MMAAPAFDPAKLGKRAVKGDAVSTGDRALILSLEGVGKTGKSDLAYRAPLPLVVQALDMGEDRPIERLRLLAPERFDKMYFYDYNFSAYAPKGSSPESTEKMVRDNVWEPFKDDFYRSVSAGVRTVVWDKATEAWEVLRLANFGRLDQIPQMMYGAINREYKEMIRAAKSAGMVLILIHDLKEEYESFTKIVRGETKESSRPTGRWVRAGNNKIDTLVDAYCRNTYIPPTKKKGSSEVQEPGRFEVEIIRAGHNAAMNGQVLESPDFGTLASLLKPGVEWSEEETA